MTSNPKIAFIHNIMFPKKEKKINPLLFFLFLSFLLHSVALLYPYTHKDGRREEKPPILVEILDFPQQEKNEKPKETTRLSQKSHSTEKETKKKVTSSSKMEKSLAKHKELAIARLPKDGVKESFQSNIKRLPKRENEKPLLPQKPLKPPETENMTTSQQNLSTPQAEGVNIPEKRLPTLEELLPSYSQLAELEKSQPQINPEDVKEEETVSLNTTEFKYISYFSTLKRQIELVWQYPLDAVIRRNQGKLFLKFTILKDGSLQDISLLRSSGYEILDDEALKAVRMASPFNPIPKQLGTKKLNIVASFEYILTHHLLR